MVTFKEVKMANKRIYVVNGDCYTPYYRIYINNEFRGVALYEGQAYDFLLRAKSRLAIRL